jgi:hypothetical protein
MATFDQLPAEQRAILELVIQRRQSYDDLAGLLGMPTARVRQLAREALADLSPRSAARVDGDWRGQVADYLLNQQTGPEGTATRGHLKRSEPARLWGLSLLDSLDHLYDERDMPVIPEGEAPPPRERERERPRERAPSPLGRRERPERPARPLSADAEAVVRRRRIAGAAGAATVVLFFLLVWPVGLLTGDDDDGGNGGSEQAEEQPQPVGQLLLRPQSGEKGVGVALISEQDGESLLLVQGRELQRTREGQAYEVWLFNRQDDAVSMGAQLTDRQGNYQGAGQLPENWQDYEFLDVSRENVDQNAAHSGDSVLRGRLDQIQETTAAPSGEGDQGGGGGGSSGSPLPGG